MEKEIFSEIIINSKPERIWEILTDFDNYSKWNPFIKSVKGQFAVGKKLTVRLEPPGAKAMTFKPTILTFEKNKEFSWIGHVLFSGIFDGEHRFELTDNGDGTTTFRQNEKFKGVLVPLFKKMLENNTLDGFKQMNQKLKELAEKK